MRVEAVPQLLLMEGISKRFPGVVALDHVNFEVERGEVMALMGENGAGKSTLIKILAGVYPKDEGRIFFDGRQVEITSPHVSQAMGISVIFQELNLLPNLTVAENIFMGRENRWGRFFVDRRRSNEMARELMRRVGLSCSPEAMVKDLPISQRQMVEVAKALSLKAKLIIMDEPTSSLTEREVDLLFAIIANLKAEGVSVVFVSHRINEVFQVADRVHILRDGKDVGILTRRDLTEDRVIRMMVGRELRSIFAKDSRPASEVVLSVRNLSTPGFLRGISFDLRRGEILGLAGLVGAGRTELIRALFGLDRRSSGEIMINGKPVRIASSTDAIRCGLGLVPEDRRQQGLILGMTVRENGSLVALPMLQWLGFVRHQRERELVDRLIALLGIKTPGREERVANLSGGNQQKVVLAKWLAAKPQILLLDEPTRGIDVGAKEEIHRIMSDLARQGMGILMISSELPEILGMSDRIIVMHEGRITGEMTRDEATQEKVMALAVR